MIPALEPRKSAVVDIGSNSVRLVIYEVTGSAALPYFNEKVLAGLGRGLPETGRLSADGVKDALGALRRYRAILQGLEVDEVIAVATAAVREATDGPDFARQAAAELGARLQILSGVEEGRLSALGVQVGFNKAEGLVGDLGGSSLEFHAIPQSADDTSGETHPLGPFALDVDPDAKASDRRKAIRKLLKGADLLTKGARRLYAVGGSWRAIASVHIELTAYPLGVLHGYRMSGQDVRYVVKEILSTQRDKDKAQRISAIVGRRYDTLIHAALVLDEVFDMGGFREVVISANGLRDGVLFNQQAGALFGALDTPGGDPLMDGLVAYLRLDQGQYEFGEALYDFIRPILTKSASRERVYRAACLAADSGGRYHPDHRADMAYHLLLRAPVTCLNHEDRVLLAHAVGLRYTHKFQRPKDFTRLGRDSDEQVARILGAAMRLGAVYSGRSAALLRSVKLRSTREKLLLEVDADAQNMISATVEKRFSQLATVMDLDSKIAVKDLAHQA